MVTDRSEKEPCQEFNPYRAPESEFVPEASDAEQLYASGVERAVAFLVDLGIILALCWAMIALTAAGAARAELIAPWLFFPVSWFYFGVLESAPFQATAGKWFLGLRVVGERSRMVTWPQATGRYFAKWLSGILFGFGFAMQPFTDQKQALHDMMSGTLVERR